MKRRQWMAVAGIAASMGTGALQAKTRPSGDRAVHLEAIQYPAWIQGSGKRRAVRPRDVVQPSDILQTGASAGMLLKMPDQSAMRLGENTRLEVQKFAFTESESGTSLQSRLNVLSGVFRLATAGVAKLTGTRDINVGLRTATIGVRGTDFWCMSDELHDAACLFEGHVQLDTNEQGRLELDQPTAFWARFFNQPPRPVGQATAAELAKFLRSTELQPGSGVAVVGGKWSVVIADDLSLQSAHTVVTALHEEGYPADLTVSTIRAGKYAVQISALATRSDAQALGDRLSRFANGQGRILWARPLG